MCVFLFYLVNMAVAAKTPTVINQFPLVPCRTACVTKELKSFSFIKDTPEMDGEAITCHTTEEEMFFYSQRAVRA